MNWQRALADHFQQDFNLCQFHPCNGGDINQSYQFTLPDNSSYFVKHHPQANKDFFSSEAFALENLKKLSPLRTPHVIHVEEFYLCLEWIESSPPCNNFFETFGELLAKQHRITSPSWGFCQNNYIGSLRQTNSPEDNFVDFFWENRLLPQLQTCQLLTKKLRKQFTKLSEKLSKLLDTPDEKPALIHGDLWSGNYICDNNNKAVLVDPSIAYSHREMEIAFTELFGGFKKDFYKAYNYFYPLTEGYNDRKDLYNLYPLLVHVNLFGGSYLSQVERIVNKYS